MNSQVRELIASAAEWRLLSLLFERPRKEWRAQVWALADSVDDEELRSLARRAASEASESQFLAALGPGSEASPREVAYRPLGDAGHLLAELQSFYNAFAFDPETEEPPDHVAVETAFVSYLQLKEAYARASGDTEAASIASDAATTFMREHLCAITTLLPVRLERYGESYLTDAARLLRAWVPFAPPVPVAATRKDEDSLFCGDCAL
jgi:nitrate reductase assembly molybdenum cofactor insertion protein NarJ